MVLAELSLFPVDKGVHLSNYVARVVKSIKESGLDYQLTAMGTLIEGEWEDVMSVVDRCYKTMEKDSDRIYIVLTIDAKKGASHQMLEKVKHVEKKL